MCDTTGRPCSAHASQIGSWKRLPNGLAVFSGMCTATVSGRPPRRLISATAWAGIGGRHQDGMHHALVALQPVLDGVVVERPAQGGAVVGVGQAGGAVDVARRPGQQCDVDVPRIEQVLLRELQGEVEVAPPELGGLEVVARLAQRGVGVAAAADGQALVAEVLLVEPGQVGQELVRALEAVVDVAVRDADAGFLRRRSSREPRSVPRRSLAWGYLQVQGAGDSLSCAIASFRSTCPPAAPSARPCRMPSHTV